MLHYLILLGSSGFSFRMKADKNAVSFVRVVILSNISLKLLKNVFMTIIRNKLNYAEIVLQ